MIIIPHAKIMMTENNEEVIIRQFQPQDQQRCIELFTNGLCSYKTPPLDRIQPIFVEMKIKSEMGNTQQYYIDKQQYYIDKHQHNFWVAELNGLVVGCVGAWPDINAIESLELIRMSVDASVRRKGIATLLIRQVENFATENGFTKVSLTTLVMMSAACSFYERCGYTRTETFKVSCLKGIDVQVQPFVKELTAAPRRVSA